MNIGKAFGVIGLPAASFARPAQASSPAAAASAGSHTPNALFRKPDAYHVGIAVVLKPQGQYDNPWYQESFMRTPKVDPKGYLTGSVINNSGSLRGDLLIMTSFSRNTCLQGRVE